MTDTKWGAPLTGAQMKLLRAAGLQDYVMVHCSYANLSHTDRADYWNYDSNGAYFLPTDHPAYTLLEAGWLDGRKKLWFGGETAPDDWDGGDVLVNDTHPRIVKGDVVDQQNWSGNKQRAKIIAYIAKDDCDHAHKGFVNRRVHCLDCDTQLDGAATNEPETVTIAKMAPDEIMERFCIPADEHHRSAFGRGGWMVLSLLGLIKPEPTREERFWALHEPEGPTVPTYIKKWVKDALEFER